MLAMFVYSIRVGITFRQCAPHWCWQLIEAFLCCATSRQAAQATPAPLCCPKLPQTLLTLAFCCLPGPCEPQVYNQPQYAGIELPFSIYTLAILNSVLMGGVELFRNSELDPERRCYPGGERREA